MKKIALFLSIFSFCTGAFSQDTLFFKNGKKQVVKVNQIVPGFVIFQKNEAAKAQKILQSKLYSISFSTGVIQQFSEQKNTKPVFPFDSIKNPYSIGLTVIPIGLHAGLHMNYFLDQRRFIQVRASYKFKSLIIAQDQIDNFIFYGVGKSYYSGPAVQVKFGTLSKQIRAHAVQSISLCYDFRYKMVDKYAWVDGIPGLDQSFVEDRAERIYAHHLLFDYTQTYRSNKKFQYGYFLEGGIKLGYKKIHEYYTEAKNVNNSMVKTKMERNKSEALLLPLTFRLGIFVNLNMLNFGKQKIK